MVLGIFKIAFSVLEISVLEIDITGDFERFQHLNFETSFLKKTKIFLKKLDYRFLVQSTTNNSATFPYKTALSEANVKTSCMGSTKWTYHKE